MMSDEQAVQLLNEAKLECDGAEKVNKLKGVYELVVNKEPDLIEEFVPEIVELQVDPTPTVRKYLPEFLIGAAQARPKASVLQLCVQCVTGLLVDSVPAPAKQAVLSSNQLFRLVLTLVAAQGGDPDQAQQLQALWGAAQNMKATVAGMAGQHANDGVRLNAAKFVEQAVLLLTADSLHPVPGVASEAVHVQPGNQVLTKSVLVKDAEGLLSQLVALLKLRVGEGVSGPVAIVVAKAAGVVAQSRPQFLGKVLPPLLAAAKAQGSDGGQQSSFAAAVRGALVGILRCSDPRAGPWRKKVTEALNAMGAGELAASTLKKVARGSKRGSSEEPDAAAKRARGDAGPGPGAPNGQQQQRPPGAPAAPQPAPAPGVAPPQFGAFPETETAALPPPTSPQDLQRVLTVLHTLVSRGDANTLAAIVGGLQPAVLADVVLSLATSLPPRHALPPDHLPLDPWLLTLVQLLAPSTANPLPDLHSLLHPSAPPPRHHGQAQQAAAPQYANAPPLASMDPGAWATPAAPPSPQPPAAPAVLTASEQLPQQPRAPTPPTQPLLPRERAGLAGRGPTPPPAAAKAPPDPSKKVAEGRAPPLKHPPPPPAVPAFKLAPLSLLPEQQAQLRQAAVLRIASSRQVARPALQRALLAKLAAGAGIGEHLGDTLLRFLLADFQGRGGLDVVLRWLDLLFAAECRPFDACGGMGGGGLDAAGLAEFVQSGLGSFLGEGATGANGETAEGEGPACADPTASAAAGGGEGCPGKGGGSVGAAGDGQYQVVLMALLEGLREVVPPTDKTIIRVLLEAPSLPMPAVRLFLRDLAASGPDWATLALLAARDVIQLRPPSRQQVLGFVLEAAGAATPDLRSKAVRLTANRLFPQTSISATIERHARQQLDSMILHATGSARPAQHAVDEGHPQAAAAAGGGDHASSGDAPAKGSDSEKHGREHGPGVGEPAPPPTDATARGATPSTGEAQGDGAAQAAAPEGKGERGDKADEATAGEAGTGGGDDVADERGAGQPAAELEEPTAAQLCALYCALCTKKHSLLRHLFEVYATTSDGGRAALHRNAPGLAKTLGAGAAALLAVVQDPPKGSLNLVINMLYVLTEAALPPPPLVAAGRQLFQQCGDPRVLPPLLAGMESAAVLRLLPSLLSLPPEAFKAAVQKLVAPQPPGSKEPPLFPASELLVALHTLDTSRDPGLLRRMMGGVSVCLSSRELFGKEELAKAINALVTRAPLPQLFMRTVIQSLSAARDLRPFVCGILAQLVKRQVWSDATQWKGWVMCAQTAAPDSFPAWLQLPAAVLSRALQGTPDAFRQQLAAYATSAKCTQSVPKPSLEVLRPFLPQEDAHG